MMTEKIRSSNVKVSDITPDGFWVHLPRKDYYILRARYPWFLDATDDEIRDVSFISKIDEYHKDMLFWHSLGIDFDGVSIENPELIYHSTLVRCVRRSDLFRGVQMSTKNNKRA